MEDNTEDFELELIRKRMRELGLKEGKDFNIVTTSQRKGGVIDAQDQLDLAKVKRELNEVIGLADERRRFYTDDLLREAKDLGRQVDRIIKFVHAYYTGGAQTFVNPDNAELVSANYEVRAFAAAILNGPAKPEPEDG